MPSTVASRRPPPVDEAVRTEILAAFDSVASALQDTLNGVDALRRNQIAVKGRTGELDAGLLALSDRLVEVKSRLRELEHTATELTRLSDDLLKVTGVLDEVVQRSELIRDIAARSNTLAINAAIEAAHAGEHGRGFAVVAGSVRELSVRTREVASEVSETLATGREEVTRIVASTRAIVASNERAMGDSMSRFEVLSAGLSEVMVLGGAIGEACDTETRELARIHAQVRAQSEEQSGRVTEIAGHLTGRRVVDIDVGGAFATLASFRVVDVRSYEEFVGELGHIDGARLETLADDIARRLWDLPRDTPLLFVCRKGGRSARAARLALDAGFSDIHNLLGGMEAWNDARLPVVLSGRAAPSTR